MPNQINSPGPVHAGPLIFSHETKNNNQMGHRFDSFMDRWSITRSILHVINFLKWLESYRLKLMERAGKTW